MPPAATAWDSLDLAAVAALLDRDLVDLREELGMLPGGLEPVALGPGPAPAAVGLLVRSAIAESGRCALAWLSARDPADALALVAAAEERAAALGAVLMQVSPRRAPGVTPLLAARGYREVNAMLRLRRTAPRPVPALPPGFRERSLDDVGLDAWVEVERESFRDVAFAVPITRADAERQRVARGFEPELFRFVADDRGAVGYLRGLLARDGTGEVETVGLVLRARRLGLGRWLLRRCEALLDARGAREIVLRVAASNTAARALYEAEGYAEVDRSSAWERALQRG